MCVCVHVCACVGVWLVSAQEALFVACFALRLVSLSRLLSRLFRRIYLMPAEAEDDTAVAEKKVAKLSRAEINYRSRNRKRKQAAAHLEQQRQVTKQLFDDWDDDHSSRGRGQALELWATCLHIVPPGTAVELWSSGGSAVDIRRLSSGHRHAIYLVSVVYPRAQQWTSRRPSWRKEKRDEARAKSAWLELKHSYDVADDEFPPWSMTMTDMNGCDDYDSSDWEECGHCGERVPQTWKTCNICGTRLTLR